MPDLSAINVTIHDCRKAGYCALGVRAWWRHQAMPVTFADFLADGLPADQFVAGGDALAAIAVERKIEREGIV